MIKREKLEWWGSLDCEQIVERKHYRAITTSSTDDLTKNNQSICIDQLRFKHLNTLRDKRMLLWLGLDQTRCTCRSVFVARCKERDSFHLGNWMTPAQIAENIE